MSRHRSTCRVLAITVLFSLALEFPALAAAPQLVSSTEAAIFEVGAESQDRDKEKLEALAQKLKKAVQAGKLSEEDAMAKWKAALRKLEQKAKKQGRVRKDVFASAGQLPDPAIRAWSLNLKN